MSSVYAAFHSPHLLYIITYIAVGLIVKSKVQCNSPFLLTSREPDSARRQRAACMANSGASLLPVSEWMQAISELLKLAPTTAILCVQDEAGRVVREEEVSTALLQVGA